MWEKRGEGRTGTLCLCNLSVNLKLLQNKKFEKKKKFSFKSLLTRTVASYQISFVLYVTFHPGLHLLPGDTFLLAGPFSFLSPNPNAVVLDKGWFGNSWTHF